MVSPCDSLCPLYILIGTALIVAESRFLGLFFHPLGSSLLACLLTRLFAYSLALDPSGERGQQLRGILPVYVSGVLLYTDTYRQPV